MTLHHLGMAVVRSGVHRLKVKDTVESMVVVVNGKGEGEEMNLDYFLSVQQR